MDPITAFAAAQTALGLIRKGVEFYKECKDAAADVTEITMEVSGNIGKFLDAKGDVEQAAAKAKRESEDPSNEGNLNSQALNNVLMQMQLEQAEVELREMLIYQAPGLNDIWSRFSKERERLTQLKIKHQVEEEKRKKEQQKQDLIQAAVRRRKFAKLWDEMQWAAVVFVMILFYCSCIYFTVKYRVEKYPELGICLIPKDTPGYKWYNSFDWIDCDPSKE
jgi:Tfp pilus assembly protein PilF